jgi:hypothetical protein
MLTKESLLSIIDAKLSLSSIDLLAKEAKAHLTEDPWFYGTLYLVAAHLSDGFDEDPHARAHECRCDKQCTPSTNPVHRNVR